MSGDRLGEWQERWADPAQRFGLLVEMLSAEPGVPKRAAAVARFATLAEWLDEVRAQRGTIEKVVAAVAGEPGGPGLDREGALELADAIAFGEAERLLDVLDVVAGAVCRLLGVGDLLAWEARRGGGRDV